MIIVGLDPAQKTGLAVYDADRSLSAIAARVLKAEGNCFEAKAGSLGRQLVVAIRDLEKKGQRPDLVAIEAPLRQKVGVQKSRRVMGLEVEDEGGSDGGGLNAVISSNQITGAIMAVLAVKSIPWVLLTSGTWRKAFLGFGRRPGWDRKDWKRAVREQCARERIPVTNDDQADAVGIAIAAKNTDAFKMLAYERSKGKAA